MKVGLVVPHIFMHRDILPGVIFAPARLALDLAEGLQALGAEVTLFSPGPVDTSAHNITANLSLFQQELRGRGDSYLDLLKKHPATFIALARQVQAEIIARAFAMANRGELDIVHIYTNEEDIALPFAQLCTKPVVFTHHDPFNFLVKYKNVFPKYAQLNWISLSYAQRHGMPPGTNWVDNVYNGIDAARFEPAPRPTGDYVAYLGRIIEPKGVHLAIAAAKKAGVPLKIAGKHYSGGKDTYWQEKIAPHIDSQHIIYEGFLASDTEKQQFLGNARALLVPSTFEEPFGMVMIEALACGTPIIGLDSGAIPEIIKPGETGFIIPKTSEPEMIKNFASAIAQTPHINRAHCRADFLRRFTTTHMCRAHLKIYRALTKTH